MQFVLSDKPETKLSQGILSLENNFEISVNNDSALTIMYSIES